MLRVTDTKQRKMFRDQLFILNTNFIVRTRKNINLRFSRKPVFWKSFGQFLSDDPITSGTICLTKTSVVVDTVGLNTWCFSLLELFTKYFLHYRSKYLSKYLGPVHALGSVVSSLFGSYLMGATSSCPCC
jgi:hypothetical protein